MLKGGIIRQVVNEEGFRRPPRPKKRVIGRYAFEALKVFVPREEELGSDRWIPLSEGVGSIEMERNERGGVSLD